jgi:choline dehydrogenase
MPEVTYISPKGERVTAERAYLTYDVLSRKNLTVATNARVTRIVFDTTGPEPKATEVEYTSGDVGPTYRVGASKEIIIS